MLLTDAVSRVHVWGILACESMYWQFIWREKKSGPGLDGECHFVILSAADLKKEEKKNGICDVAILGSDQYLILSA